MNNKKLRVVVLYSSGHLGSATVLNKLCAMPEFEIVGLLRCQTVRCNKKGLAKAWQHMRKLGWRFTWLLLWQRLIQMFVALLSRLLPREHKWRPGWALSAKHKIPVFHCQSVNDAASQNWLKAQAPDLIISAYFTQILKAPVIDIPQLGVLNIHPGYLPDYRGAMCYFWSLLHKKPYAGVSVHWIDEGIDTGALLARKRIPLQRACTQERALYCSAIIGCRLLQRVAQQLRQGIQPSVIDTIYETAHYYRMPKRRDFLAYFKHHRFFRIRDILALLRCRAY